MAVHDTGRIQGRMRLGRMRPICTYLAMMTTSGCRAMFALLLVVDGQGGAQAPAAGCGCTWRRCVEYRVLVVVGLCD